MDVSGPEFLNDLLERFDERSLRARTQQPEAHPDELAQGGLELVDAARTPESPEATKRHIQESLVTSMQDEAGEVARFFREKGLQSEKNFGIPIGGDNSSIAGWVLKRYSPPIPAHDYSVPSGLGGPDPDRPWKTISFSSTRHSEGHPGSTGLILGTEGSLFGHGHKGGGRLCTLWVASTEDLAPLQSIDPQLSDASHQPTLLKWRRHLVYLVDRLT